MHYQNVIAYTYGVLFNLGFVFIDSSSRAMVRSGGLLVGFNTCSWLYVVVTAMMGLSTSFIYKYADAASPIPPHPRGSCDHLAGSRPRPNRLLERAAGGIAHGTTLLLPRLLPWLAR
jgi:hypothetical protein